jgi:hypothetical protein
MGESGKRSASRAKRLRYVGSSSYVSRDVHRICTVI